MIQSLVSETYLIQTTVEHPMKTGSILTLIGLALCLGSCLEPSQLDVTPKLEPEEKIPKIIWIYWDDTSTMPEGIQMLYHKLVQVADASEWVVNLVDDRNIDKYIENAEQFQKVYKNDYYPKIPQIKSDLIRHALIYYNGGVWIDISSIVLENFDWITNIENETHIYNKYEQKYPDVVLFFSEFHQLNKKYQIGEKRYIEQPGYENWFIAARKKSKFMRDTFERLKEVFVKPHESHAEQLYRDDIFLDDFGQSPYWRGYYVWYSTLQQKQRYLDSLLGFFSEKRIIVEDYYKIWAIHSQIGPQRFYLENKPKILCHRTEEQIYNEYSSTNYEYGPVRYFLKQTHFFAPSMQELYQTTRQYKINEEKGFPDKKSKCHLPFHIMKDSIFDKHVIKNNPYLEERSLKVFTSEEIVELSEECEVDFQAVEGSVHGTENLLKFLMMLLFTLGTFISFLLFKCVQIHRDMSRNEVEHYSRCSIFKRIFTESHYLFYFCVAWLEYFPIVLYSQYYVYVLNHKELYLETFLMWVYYFVVHGFNKRYFQLDQNNRFKTDHRLFSTWRRAVDPLLNYSLASMTLELAVNVRSVSNFYALNYGIFLPIILSSLAKYQFRGELQKLKRCITETLVNSYCRILAVVWFVLCLNPIGRHYLPFDISIFKLMLYIGNFTFLYPALLLYCYLIYLCFNGRSKIRKYNTVAHEDQINQETFYLGLYVIVSFVTVLLMTKVQYSNLREGNPLLIYTQMILATFYNSMNKLSYSQDITKRSLSCLLLDPMCLVIWVFSNTMVFMDFRLIGIEDSIQKSETFNFYLTYYGLVFYGLVLVQMIFTQYSTSRACLSLIKNRAEHLAISDHVDSDEEEEMSFNPLSLPFSEGMRIQDGSKGSEVKLKKGDSQQEFVRSSTSESGIYSVE